MDGTIGERTSGDNQDHYRGKPVDTARVRGERAIPGVPDQTEDDRSAELARGAFLLKGFIFPLFSPSSYTPSGFVFVVDTIYDNSFINNMITRVCALFKVQ